MDALINLATAAAEVNKPYAEGCDTTDAPASKAYIRKSRPTHTAYQKTVMGRYYEYNKLPDAKERAALGQAIGLNARAVQVWFQNRRQRQKPPADPNAPPKMAWVEMEASKRLTQQTAAALAGAQHVHRPPAPDLHGLNKDQSADAIVAAVQQQANMTAYQLPDPVQLERDRALAAAIAHAKTAPEKAPDRGYESPPDDATRLAAPAAPTFERAPAPVMPVPQPAAAPSASPAPHMPAAPPAYAPAACASPSPPLPPQTGVDPLSLPQAPKQQIELRNALLDALSKLPGAENIELPEYIPPTRMETQQAPPSPQTPQTPSSAGYAPPSPLPIHNSIPMPGGPLLA